MHPTDHPNFAGDEIQFGLMFFGGNPGGTIYWDNLSFTLNQTPLPTALPLFAGGLGVMALLARLRKRKGTAALAVA